MLSLAARGRRFGAHPVRGSILLAALSLTIASGLDGCASRPAPPHFARAHLPTDHPLVGRWQMIFPQTKCHEEMELMADGTRTSVSGLEQLKTDFAVSELKAGRATIYQWTDRVLATNGKPDCYGNLTPKGDVVTLYLYVNPADHRLQECFRPDLTQCSAFFEKR